MNLTIMEKIISQIPVFFIRIFFLILLSMPLFGQTSEPAILNALEIKEDIELDGKLNESCWQEAQKIDNFTQRELNNGDPPTEKTEVAIIYNRAVMYIGIWCYDSQPEEIMAKDMNRDFDHSDEDNFEVIFDTFHDQRNAYLFIINPNGARRDALITDNGGGYNEDWNGIWDVETTITKDGWFAEIEIPFYTLRFPDAIEQIWGINFERNIRRKQEQLMWQGWSRDYDLEQISEGGILSGLENIVGNKRLELKPYGTLGIETAPDEDNKYITKIGGDANYLITPRLKLNLTANTDFAQVEADREIINLSRFSVLYPEKREFFLEGKNLFEMDYSGMVKLFYSRQIGIHRGEQIPIIGGARLTGKTDGANLGVMSIQTAEKGDQPTANYSVARVKYDVLERSYVGALFTGKNQGSHYNYMWAADGLYSTSDLFGDKNFSVGGAAAHSITKGIEGRKNTTWRVNMSYPNDFIHLYTIYQDVPKNFNPEMGFMRRTNFKNYYANLSIMPRPEFIPWIEQLEIMPLNYDHYWNGTTGETETIIMRFMPLEIRFTSGEEIDFQIFRDYDKLKMPFYLIDSIGIDAGEYWFTRYEVEFDTYRGRNFYFTTRGIWGDFYSGTRDQYFLVFGMNINEHMNVAADYERNIVSLPAGNFDTDEVGGRFEYSFNPKLYSSLFGQWNDQLDEIILNFRINWIPVIGSDFYFVLNQRISTENPKWTLDNTAILTKMVWRFSM